MVTSFLVTIELIFPAVNPGYNRAFLPADNQASNIVKIEKEVKEIIQKEVKTMN
jgi:hypothetical protein